MRLGPTGRVTFLGTAAVCLLLSSGGPPPRADTAAVATRNEKTAYTTRLRLPFRNDSLGISRSVTADPATGEIFICDWRHGRIVIFDDQLLFRYIISGRRTGSSPAEVAIDPDGFLLVLPSADQPLVYLDFDGAYLGEMSLLNLPPDLPEKPRLVSVALSPDGATVYTLDGNNQRLWLSGRDGQVKRSVQLAAGRSEQEIRDFIFGRVDVYGDTVTVAVPTDGRIMLFDLDGTARGFVGLAGTAPCQTAFPVAAALDAEGRLLVLDNQRALVSIWQVEGNACLGEFAGFGNAPGALYRPSDISLDARGRVYVSQGFEGRVQVYQHGAPAAGSPRQVGAPAPSTAPAAPQPGRP